MFLPQGWGNQPNPVDWNYVHTFLLTDKGGKYPIQKYSCYFLHWNTKAYYYIASSQLYGFPFFLISIFFCVISYFVNNLHDNMLILWDELPSTVPLILGVCSWTLQHMCEDNIAWMINHLSTEPSLTCLQWMLVNFMNKGIACQCLRCIQKIY